MRIFGIGWLILVCLSLPLLSSAQSLGSVAKKERERRDKNKKEGVAAREFSEEEVFGEKEEDAATAEDDSSGETEGVGEPPTEEELIPGVKASLPDDVDPDEESRERKRSEAEWRSKASTARARVAKARTTVQYFENLYLPPNGRYVDSQGRTVIESLDHLKRLTQEAREELVEAEAAWKALQAEARRSAIPPGWLR